MQLGTPDLLRPISPNNRNEIIAIPFHRVYKNTNMSLLRNVIDIILQDKEKLQLFPKVTSYISQTAEQMFMSTSLYNEPWELIRELSDNNLDVDACKSLADGLLYPLHLTDLHHTRIEMIIRNLSKMEFVHKIYFIADKVTTEMTDYIVNQFDAKYLATHIDFREGDLLDLLSEDPGITTVFMNQSSDFFAFQSQCPDQVKGKFFLILEGYQDYEVDPATQKMRAKYIKEFERYTVDRVAEISYVLPQISPI